MDLYIICPPVLKGRNCEHVESALPKKLSLGQLASGTTSQYATLLQRSIMEDPYLDKSGDQLLTTTFILNGLTITAAVMLCTRLPDLPFITIWIKPTVISLWMLWQTLCIAHSCIACLVPQHPPVQQHLSYTTILLFLPQLNDYVK